jgi:zinc transporter, ZIP family
MLEAGFWGLVGGLALLIGALVGLRMRTSGRLIGLIMAFGSGVLVSALAFELTRQAFERGGAAAVVGGLAAGALTFYPDDARGLRARRRQRRCDHRSRVHPRLSAQRGQRLR